MLKIKMLAGAKLHLSVYLYIVKAYCCTFKFSESYYLKSILKQRSTNQDKANIPDECLLPKIHPYFEWYNRISTSYMAFVLIKHSLPIDWIVSLLNLPLPGNCYAIGRFVLHDTLSRYYAMSFAAGHILWRLTTFSVYRTFKLETVLFMIQDNENLEKNHNIIGKVLAEGKPGKLTNYQTFLAKIMYYQIEHKGNLIYMLRPNRTLAAHRSVARYIAKLWFLSTRTFAMLFIVFFLVCISTILKDKVYSQAYPGCSPNRKILKDAGGVEIWSKLPGVHRIIAFTFDFLESLLLWVDSGFALLFGLTITYIFNYDLTYYWNNLQQKINEIHLILTEAREKRNPEYKKNLKHENYTFQQTLIMKDSLSDLSFKTDWERNMDIIIFKLQAEISDFFTHLKDVDELTSDVITASLIIWLMVFAYVTYLMINHSGGKINLEIRIIQWFAVIALTIDNLFLLALQRSIKRSYKTICSIMALDRSEYRFRFPRIIDFFTLDSFSYTLLHKYPYTSMTTISIAGWSISAAILAENFMRR